MYMRFYPPNPRRGPVPPLYRQQFRPSNRMDRRPDSFNYPNQFGRREDFYSYPYQYSRQRQPYYYPEQHTGYDSPVGNSNVGNSNERPRPSRFGRLPEHFDTLMGHADKVQNGINMMRQVSSFLGMFR
mgnify:FL=1